MMLILTCTIIKQFTIKNGDRMVQTIAVFVAGMALTSVVIRHNESKANIINRTNGIYKNIKLIVTDEAVSKMISNDATVALVEAERIYLEAIHAFKESEDLNSHTGIAALQPIVSCADTVLTVIDTIDVPEEYDPVITAVRFSVKLLKTNLST